MNDSTYWDLHSRAVAAFHEANLTEAEETFVAARQEAKDRRIFALADRAYCNWAAVQLERGHMAAAQEGLSRVLGTSKDPKARQLAAYSLAALNDRQGNFRAAQFYAGMSQQLVESLGDRRGQASTSHLLGLLSAGENRFDLAQEHLWRSLEITTKDEVYPYALLTMTVLGYFLCLAGDMNQSLWLLEEAQETMSAPGCRFYAPAVRLTLGFAYLEWGDLDEAIEQGETALVLLKERECDGESEKFIYYLLGEAHAQKGSDREAKEHFEILQKTWYPQYPEVMETLLSFRTSRLLNWLGR